MYLPQKEENFFIVVKMGQTFLVQYRDVPVVLADLPMYSTYRSSGSVLSNSVVHGHFLSHVNRHKHDANPCDYCQIIWLVLHYLQQPKFQATS